MTPWMQTEVHKCVPKWPLQALDLVSLMQTKICSRVILFTRSDLDLDVLCQMLYSQKLHSALLILIGVFPFVLNAQSIAKDHIIVNFDWVTCDWTVKGMGILVEFINQMGMVVDFWSDPFDLCKIYWLSSLKLQLSYFTQNC